MHLYLKTTMLITKMFSVEANMASKKQPTVEVLDNEFLHVDYSKSFNITDFSPIRTAIEGST